MPQFNIPASSIVASSRTTAYTFVPTQDLEPFKPEELGDVVDQLNVGLSAITPLTDPGKISAELVGDKIVITEEISALMYDIAKKDENSTDRYKISISGSAAEKLGLITFIQQSDTPLQTVSSIQDVVNEISKLENQGETCL